MKLTFMAVLMSLAFATATFAADSELIPFAEGLATQLSAPVKSIFIKTEDVDTAEIDDRIMSDNEAYVNISSILFSGLVRYVTGNKLDLLLLTNADSYDDNGYFMSGVELGLRANELYGLRLGVLNDEENDKGYKMQFEFYPSKDSAILVSHTDDPIEDEEQTGIEWKLDF